MLALTANSTALIVVAIAFIVLLVMGISLFGAALNGVFQAALYNYVSTGNPGQGFQEHLVRDAFRPKQR
jgi:Flp pilus assembly pilin Flp